MSTSTMTIADRLQCAGYGHRRDDNTTKDYRHQIYRLADGTIIGRMDAKEAVEFLAAEKLPT